MVIKNAKLGLKKHINYSNMNPIKKPVALIILDGWGYREDKEHNAVAQAHTPFFDELWQTYNPTLLEASGLSVGLPEGQMGTSEVGHTTIGAGKVIDTDLVRISKSISNNEFSTNPAFTKLFAHVLQNNSTLHIQGLVSPGGVHSHSEHLYTFLKAAKEAGITKIAIHAFTDGRDTAPQSASNYLKELENIIDELGIGFIATASGRFYAMDRSENWERLKTAEDAIFEGKGKTYQNKKPSEAMQELYQEGIIDETLEPVIFLDDQGNSYPIQANDGIFFFNFRSDRARMLSKKIIDKASEMNWCYATMTEYDKNFDCLVAFPAINIETTLANEISKAGLRQVHIAETEKFAHATYFLNGGKQEPHENEEHVVLPSHDVDSHDKIPEMRAEGIANKAIEYIDRDFDFIFINFANADMIGHTANFEATVKAVEEVDLQLRRVVGKIKEKGGVAFVTADHGNAEINVDSQTGEKHTAHTTSLVPAIITDEKINIHQGGLADVAPTVLELIGLNKPEAMTGKSLIDY